MLRHPSRSRRARRTACIAALLSATGCSIAAASPCQQAASAAARARGVPEQLLQSIARVESAGQPYAVNVDGVGQSFSGMGQAIDFVRAASAAGARFIDVGCFQIDLHYHPDAFADLSAAFDPALNAAYAARFLVSLRGADAGWDNAIGAYHSRDPMLGRIYRDRVYGVGDPAGGAPPAGEGATRWFAGVRLETPGTGSAPVAGLPRVFTP